MFLSTRSLLSRAMLPLASALQGSSDDASKQPSDRPPPNPPGWPVMPTPIPSRSPLTYNKVFLALPRLSNCKTPEINSKIAKPWSLQPVQDRTQFKTIYKEGRDSIRYIFPLCCMYVCIYVLSLVWAVCISVLSLVWAVCIPVLFLLWAVCKCISIRVFHFWNFGDFFCGQRI